MTIMISGGGITQKRLENFYGRNVRRSTAPNLSGYKKRLKLKMITIDNKTEQEQRAEVKNAEPLFTMPAVEHLMPTDDVFPKEKCEDGSKPLRNRKREAFCTALTGWGGDGKRIENYRAYEIAFGNGGASARANSTRLLAIPEVKARVEYLSRKVEEAKHHDYLAAQQSFDEFRLGVVERAKVNPKLVPMALVAARDFEKAHGLDASAPGKTTTTVEESAEVTRKAEVLPGLIASLKRVVKTTLITENRRKEVRND